MDTVKVMRTGGGARAGGVVCSLSARFFLRLHERGNWRDVHSSQRG